MKLPAIVFTSLLSAAYAASGVQSWPGTASLPIRGDRVGRRLAGHRIAQVSETAAVTIGHSES
jgi:hypothetical protein